MRSRTVALPAAWTSASARRGMSTMSSMSAVLRRSASVTMSRPVAARMSAQSAVGVAVKTRCASIISHSIAGGGSSSCSARNISAVDVSTAMRSALGGV